MEHLFTSEQSAMDYFGTFSLELGKTKNQSERSFKIRNNFWIIFLKLETIKAIQ